VSEFPVRACPELRAAGRAEAVCVAAPLCDRAFVGLGAEAFCVVVERTGEEEEPPHPATATSTAPAMRMLADLLVFM
jgi:hypothetical protein